MKEKYTVILPSDLSFSKKILHKVRFDYRPRISSKKIIFLKNIERFFLHSKTRIVKKKIADYVVKHTETNHFFQKHWFFFAALPVDIAQCKKILTNAALATYPEHHSLKKIAEEANFSPVSAMPKFWQIAHEDAQAAANMAGLSYEYESGKIYDVQTGFEAYFFSEHTHNTFRLIFGRQKISIFQSIVKKVQKKIGKKNDELTTVNKKLEQAKQLTNVICHLLKEKKMDILNHLALVGYADGGLLALFSSLSHSMIVKTSVFACDIPDTFFLSFSKEHLCHAAPNIEFIMLDNPLLSFLSPNKSKNKIGICIALYSKHYFYLKNSYHFLINLHRAFKLKPEKMTNIFDYFNRTLG